MPTSPNNAENVVLIHSSDLHIDDGPRVASYTGLIGLASVLATACSVRANAVLLAGDTFDNHRVSDSVLRQAGALIAAAKMQVILLPGNHDPAMGNCLFRRAGLLALPNVNVLGVTDPGAVTLADQKVEIRGRAHHGYEDMTPFHAPRSRQTRWLIVMAHGHYLPACEWKREAHRAWKFGDDDIVLTGADYVALGHWDRAAKVGDGRVPAYYSGSPDVAGTVNVIRLSFDCGVIVDRIPLVWADGYESIGIQPLETS
jgi:DNA repair exonuclease SbcCD nuclease subunit